MTTSARDALVIALLLLQQATTPLATWAILRLDERFTRGDDVKRDRGWPPASRMAAIVVFSPFCLLVHFLRTRRSAGGLLLGLAGIIVATLPAILVSWLTDVALVP